MGIPYFSEDKGVEAGKEVVIWTPCGIPVLQLLSLSISLYSQMSSLELTETQVVALCSNTFLLFNFR